MGSARLMARVCKKSIYKLIKWTPNDFTTLVVMRWTSIREPRTVVDHAARHAVSLHITDHYNKASFHMPRSFEMTRNISSVLYIQNNKKWVSALRHANALKIIYSLHMTKYFVTSYTVVGICNYWALKVWTIALSLFSPILTPKLIKKVWFKLNLIFKYNDFSTCLHESSHV